MSSQPSSRSNRVARLFGIDPDQLTRANRAARSPQVSTIPILSPGQIIAITGPSGAGKSRLLACLRRRYHRRCAWIDLDQISLPHTPVIDVIARALAVPDDDPGVVLALEALSRVGLGEVWTYLRTPAQLSQGQQWRLRLALALAIAKNPQFQPALPRTQHSALRTKHSALRTQHSDLCILVSDDFATKLDRISAAIAGRLLHKSITASPNLCALIASPREELPQWISPTHHIPCDFGP